MAFLHGDPWVVLIIPLLVGIVILSLIPVVFFVWFRFTKLPAYYLSIAYLIVATILLLVRLLDFPGDAASISFLVGAFITLPWSALLGLTLDKFVSSIGNGAMTTISIGGGGLLNAAIIYTIGAFARRRQKKSLE